MVGTILRTTDGGTNWTTQTSGVPNWMLAVSFVNENVGTIAVANGIILRTDDGGQNWVIQNSITSNMLYGISCPDVNTATIVGDGGTIIRTTDAGLPVELTSFTASVNVNKVILNWNTATETNNSGFDVERSQRSEVGNQSWQKIGFVAGNGTTTQPEIYSFIDKDVSNGSYVYRLKQIDFDGSYKYSKEVEVSVNVPSQFSLSQNYPNPFNPTTTIDYSIPKDGNVSLTVYNILGQQVVSLVNGNMKSGQHQVTFDASRFASGVYYYRLESNNHVMVKKMMLMK